MEFSLRHSLALLSLTGLPPAVLLAVLWPRIEDGERIDAVIASGGVSSLAVLCAVIALQRWNESMAHRRWQLARLEANHASRGERRNVPLRSWRRSHE